MSVFWVLSTFTGVNLYVGILITIVCAFLISGAFGLLSQIMPRSGGDYILISRSLHPGLAVGSSILIGTSSMLAMGYWGVFTANICIGPMLTMFGVAVNSHWLAERRRDAHPSPLEHDHRLRRGRDPGRDHGQRDAPADARAVLAVRRRHGRLHRRRDHAAGDLALRLHQRLQHYARPFTHHANTYRYFMAQARHAGIDTHAPTNWHNTIIASGAFIAFGVWAWYSANYAGEIRQAGTRKNWYSMLGGLALTFVPILLMVLPPGQDRQPAVPDRRQRRGEQRQRLHAAQPAVVDHARGDDPQQRVFVAFLGLTFIAGRR